MNIEALTRHIPAPYLYFGAGLASAALWTAISNTIKSNKTFASPSPILPSPLAGYEHDSDGNDLAYPPHNLLPGARDVTSPYGTTRVYEYGPEDATHRILFLHGISTPSIALAGVADALAARGARVMLLDLFGRGWSDAPADLPHDGRLYATQVLLALTSSPVAWTGGGSGGARFALAGYSLGGGLAADFAAWFPELVGELVLLAPGGLLREKNIAWRSLLMYYLPGFFPQAWTEALVARSLRSAPNVTGSAPAPRPRRSDDGEKKPTAAVAPSAEVPAHATMPTATGAAIDLPAAVDWQIAHHAGFLPAFVSAIRCAPIQRQHARWALLGRRARDRKALLAALAGRPPRSRDEARVLGRGLASGGALVLLGGRDRLVRAEEVAPDARAAVGEGEVDVRVFPDAGHELPITHAQEVADAIWEHWTRA